MYLHARDLNQILMPQRLTCNHRRTAWPYHLTLIHSYIVVYKSKNVNFTVLTNRKVPIPALYTSIYYIQYNTLFPIQYIIVYNVLYYVYTHA